MAKRKKAIVRTILLSQQNVFFFSRPKTDTELHENVSLSTTPGQSAHKNSSCMRAQETKRNANFTPPVPPTHRALVHNANLSKYQQKKRILRDMNRHRKKDKRIKKKLSKKKNISKKSYYHYFPYCAKRWRTGGSKIFLSTLYVCVCLCLGGGEFSLFRAIFC